MSELKVFLVELCDHCYSLALFELFKCKMILFHYFAFTLNTDEHIAIVD